MIGMGIGLGIYIPPFKPDVLTADWARRVIVAGGRLTPKALIATNDFVRRARAAGILSRLLRVNLFLGGNLNAAMVPLVTNIGPATDVAVNLSSANYVEADGLTGGSGAYVDTGTPPPVPWGGMTVDFRGQILTTGRTALWGAQDAAASNEFSLHRHQADKGWTAWGNQADNNPAISFIPWGSASSATGLQHTIRRSATSLNFYRYASNTATNPFSHVPSALAVNLAIMGRRLAGGAIDKTGGGPHAGYAIDDGTMPTGDESTWNGIWSALRAITGR
jgi:hypothetical protein